MTALEERTATAIPAQAGKPEQEMIERIRWPQALTFGVRPFDQGEGAKDELIGRVPETITLLRPVPENPAADQLFLDRRPVPRDMWSLDPHDAVLSWRGDYGGGRLHLAPDLRVGNGLIGALAEEVAVNVVYRKAFTCKVAADTGAKAIVSGGAVTGLSWNPEDQQWKNAKWGNDVLKFKYEYEPGEPPADPAVLKVEFDDTRCSGNTWNPGTPGSEYQVRLSASQDGPTIGWKFDFVLTGGASPIQGCDTKNPLYPYRFHCRQPWSADSLTGAILVGSGDLKGKVLGVKGEYASPEVTGYYNLTSDHTEHAPVVGVFDGQLYVDDQPVTETAVIGYDLVWQDLPAHIQKATGLAAEGALSFGGDGASATGSVDGIQAVRLTGSELSAMLAQQPQNYAVLQTAVAATAPPVPKSLNIETLLAMSPFDQDSKNNWYDAVQKGVRDDLHTMMSSFIPNDVWQLLFPDTNRPTIDGYRAQVASTKVNGQDPAPWYASLSTAVLAQGMAGGSDPNCAKLNGKRAETWLRDQVSVNDVYRKHGDLLYQYQWKKIPRNSSTPQFLADQARNTADQKATIDKYVEKWITEMKNTVSGDAGMLTKLETLIKEIGSVGKQGKYWAFLYYYRATHANTWANLKAAIDSPDKTALTRLVEQNISVLHALDSSGYFARKYIEALHVALSTTIFLQLIDFKGVLVDFDLIKLYLQKFVEKNINSTDAKIKEQAQKLKQMLDEEAQNHFIETSVKEIRRIAGVINAANSFGRVATEFVAWFEKNCPAKFKGFGKVFGGMLLSGLAGFAMNNLLGPYKDWNKLNADQKAELITNTVQLGLQVVSAIAKRGVQLYAVFNAGGMTNWQRVGAMAWTTLGGKPEALARGMSKISNAMARYIAGGSASIRAGAAAAEEASLLARVMGPSLTKFIATRIGPLFVLAGIAFSIYNLTKGGSTLEIIAEVLGLISGVLTLLAMFGGWALASIGISAAFISVFIPIVGALAVVAALAGMAIGLFLMFKKPPNPVEKFVNDYAGPAGLTMRARCSAIDYAVPYVDKSQQNLVMLGARFGSDGKVMTAKPDGTITLGTADNHAATVWNTETGGLGMTQICTLVDKGNGMVSQYLSVLDDGTVAFRDLATKEMPVEKVKSQYWVTGVTGDATVTNENNLKTLPLVLQPVYPDSKGEFLPANKKKYLAVDGNGVKLVDSGGTTWTLTMAGRAPAAMTMDKIELFKGTEPATSYSPVFGQMGSNPMTFSIKSGTLPSFLTLDSGTGEIKVTGKLETVLSKTSYTLVAKNSLGSTEATFTVEVKEP